MIGPTVLEMLASFLVRSVRPLKVSLNSSETCRITDCPVRKYRCLSEEPFITLATVVGGVVHSPLVTALRRQRQQTPESEASLVYRASSRT